jgi:hypothetical protein
MDKVKPLSVDERLDPIWYWFFRNSKHYRKFREPLDKLTGIRLPEQSDAPGR